MTHSTQTLRRARQASLRVVLLSLVCCGLTFSSLQAQTFMAKLSGTSSIPTVTTLATGEVTGTLDGNMLTVEGSFSGLMGEFAADVGGGAHLHGAMAGSNGGIEIPLNATVDDDLHGGTFEAENNTFELTDEQMAALMARGLYANIHTSAWRSGELRGQLVPASDALYQAVLTGGSEVPTVNTTATGGLVLELDGDTLTATGSFNGLQSDFSGASHLHVALAGRSGGVAIPLNATANDDLRGGVFEADSNTFVLDAEQMAALEGRRYYANIHSTDAPGGEVRGQVLPIATAYFEAILSGGAEVPPVETTGTGGLLIELDGDTLTATGSFSDLVSAFNADVAGGAHLHTGLAGMNAGIGLPLQATVAEDGLSGSFEAADNRTVLLGDEELALKNALMARGVYANVHTMDSPSGEIRGQALPKADLYFQGSLSGLNEVPQVVTTGIGGVAAELHGEQLILSGSFSELEGDFDATVAGGAHIHEAAAGETGGIIFPLSTEVNEDLRGGFFRPDSNVFTLDEDQLDALQNALYYANVHTTNVGSGEIRAQLYLSPNNMPVATPVEDETTLPSRFAVKGNYPNPFNPATTVRFDLPEPADVRVDVFDVMGRRVLTLPERPMNAGTDLAVRINGASLASGVYLYQITAQTPNATWTDTGRMALVK